MRVLHFYKTAYPDSIGGTEQVIDQIARGGKHFGIESDVLSLSPNAVPRSTEINGYCLHRAHLDFQLASTGFSFSALFRFAELAKRADVIHYHYPWPFMDVVHFATHVRKPTVVTYHSDIVRQANLAKIYSPLRRVFLGSVDRIVATSPNYLESSDVLAKYRYKVSVIPIGLDKFTYPTPNLDRLHYWRNKLGTRFFLFVGALRYYKGLEILLEAAKGFHHPIVIVGEGPLEEELKQKATQLGLDNVCFLGWLPDEDKVALLTLCYAVVFPSHLRSEAFGVSLLEGAMFGKPLISCEISTGTSFINIANETGLVVPPSDPAALRRAMQYLWDNPDMAAEMGQLAAARYWRMFTADKMVGKYVDLYNGLLLKRRQTPVLTHYPNKCDVA